MMQRWRQFISNPYVIVAAAFVLRLGYHAFLVYQRAPSKGQGVLKGFETVQIATSIATGHGFSSPLAVQSGPTAWLTPVFPYLLALIFKVFGVGTLGAEGAIKCLDALFSSLVCLPLVAIGRRLTAPWVGVLSAWLWALLPSSVVFAVVWVWDTSLTALCLTVLLYFTLVISETQGWRLWLAYAALWAFSALTNAIVLSALPGLALFAIYRARAFSALWLRNATVAALLFLAGIAPWIVRNEIVFHGQVAFRSNFPLELWLGNNPQVPDIWAPWLHPANDPKERKHFQEVGEVAYMNEKRHAALQFITSHPAETLEFTYHRFMITWTGGDNYLNDFGTDLPLGLRIDMLLSSAFSLVAFVGLWNLLRKNPAEAIPFAWIMFAFPLVYYITHPSPRYRSPMDPCMAFLAMYAVVTPFSRLRKAPALTEEHAESLVRTAT
ncbi:MAG TPA: glycosyltransferase family 39 protein [Verrucomicrobiae bacterium]|nr:glycosyltransferase family 39 protein [Verrucomicrobiae bacterium]